MPDGAVSLVGLVNPVVGTVLGVGFAGELFGWPQLVAVTDLESALRAVEEIIEQGEGAQGDWDDAHYGRFLSVRQEYDALRQADPARRTRTVLRGSARR